MGQKAQSVTTATSCQRSAATSRRMYYNTCTVFNRPTSWWSKFQRPTRHVTYSSYL